MTVITNTFVGNNAENGGAVFIDGCGKAVVSDNTFARNRAGRSGGAIFQNKCSGVRFVSDIPFSRVWLAE